MHRIETSESFHDRDWKENKADDSSLKSSLRFQTLMNLIRKRDPAIVFDIGCGSGYLGKQIKKWKPEVILHGCAISASALERAKLHFEKVWKINLDGKYIPAESAVYDIVICSEVLEHIYDVNHVLREVNRLLKSNGVGLLTVPNLAYWRFRLDIFKGCLPIPAGDDRHLHQFTRDSLANKVLQANMETLSVSGCRIKLPWLADWKPSVFSDTLVFVVKKAAEKRNGL